MWKDIWKNNMSKKLQSVDDNWIIKKRPTGVVRLHIGCWTFAHQLLDVCTSAVVRLKKAIYRQRHMLVLRPTSYTCFKDLICML